MQTLAGFHPLPTAYDRANKHLQVVVESVRLRLIEMEALLFSYVDYWQYAGIDYGLYITISLKFIDTVYGF